MGEETIRIDSCPICKGIHIYRLDVDRAVFLKMMTPGDMYERSRNVRVTRIFICPKENEQFQATFYLQDTSSDRIKSVSIIGPKEKSNED